MDSGFDSGVCIEQHLTELLRFKGIANPKMKILS